MSLFHDFFVVVATFLRNLKSKGLSFNLSLCYQRNQFIFIFEITKVLLNQHKKKKKITH